MRTREKGRVSATVDIKQWHCHHRLSIAGNKCPFSQLFRTFVAFSSELPLHFDFDEKKLRLSSYSFLLISGFRHLISCSHIPSICHSLTHTHTLGTTISFYLCAEHNYPFRFVLYSTQNCQLAADVFVCRSWTQRDTEWKLVPRTQI